MQKAQLRQGEAFFAQSVFQQGAVTLQQFANGLGRAPRLDSLP